MHRQRCCCRPRGEAGCTYSSGSSSSSSSTSVWYRAFQDPWGVDRYSLSRRPSIHRVSVSIMIFYYYSSSSLYSQLCPVYFGAGNCIVTPPSQVAVISGCSSSRMIIGQCAFQKWLVGKKKGGYLSVVRLLTTRTSATIPKSGEITCPVLLYVHPLDSPVYYSSPLGTKFHVPY